jgi:hypothetical protein
MRLRALFILTALIATLFVWGCSDKKPTSNIPNPNDTTSTFTTTWNSAGYWEVTVNATNTSQYAYYGLARKDTLTLTADQAASNTSWNIGFKRSGIILNGGASGPGDVEAVDLATCGHIDSTDFMGFDNSGSLPDTSWASDSFSLVINNWYLYNHTTHELTPTRYVYIMKDASGNYVKFQVYSMMNPGMPPNMGMLTIVYKYSGSSPTFTGAPDTLTLDATGGTAYIDFSTGSVVHPADPRSSTDWDLEFTNYEVHQNATIFGPGQCGTYEVWREQTDSTNFNETSTAPTAPQAYFADNLGSVMANWYDYDGNSHILSSKNHVYAIRSGGHNYKLQIVTYYKDISGTPVSGWYTFRWAALD